MSLGHEQMGLPPYFHEYGCSFLTCDLFSVLPTRQMTVPEQNNTADLRRLLCKFGSARIASSIFLLVSGVRSWRPAWALRAWIQAKLRLFWDSVWGPFQAAPQLRPLEGRSGNFMRESGLNLRQAIPLCFVSGSWVLLQAWLCKKGQLATGQLTAGPFKNSI